METQTLTAQTLQACRASSAQGGNPSLILSKLKCCKVSPKSSSVEGRTPERDGSYTQVTSQEWLSFWADKMTQ